MTTLCFPALFFPLKSCKESILHLSRGGKGLQKFNLRFSFYMHNAKHESAQKINTYLLSRFLRFTNQFLHSFLINTLYKQTREQSNREREPVWLQRKKGKSRSHFQTRLQSKSKHALCFLQT